MRAGTSRYLLFGLGLLALLAGCGNSDDKVPPTVTRVASTVVAEDPTTSSTLAADEITAGTIADRMAAAWSSVQRYQSVTVILPTIGTPIASPEVELTGR